MLDRSLSMKPDIPKDSSMMDMYSKNSPENSHFLLLNDEASFDDFDPSVEADILESQFESLAKEVEDDRYESEIFWGNFLR